MSWRRRRGGCSSRILGDEQAWRASGFCVLVARVGTREGDPPRHGGLIVGRVRVCVIFVVYDDGRYARESLWVDT